MSDSVRLPFLWKTAQEDREWVSTIQDGPEERSRPGHFDPYTGERVERTIWLPDIP